MQSLCPRSARRRGQHAELTPAGSVDETAKEREREYGSSPTLRSTPSACTVVLSTGTLRESQLLQIQRQYEKILETEQ